MLELGVKFLVSYFVGSVMGAIIVGKLRGGVDIRTQGSGNAGGTNALRTQGALFALGVIIIDIGKGVIAVSIVPDLSIPFVARDPELSRTWLTICCAAAVVLGHVWPVYHDFKGGKGAGTFVGTLVILGPKLIIGLVLVWASVIALSGFVGLATIIAALALPIYLATLLPDGQPVFIYATVMALFITYWHRANIQRMREGSEHRNTRLMIFRQRRAAQPNDDA